MKVRILVLLLILASVTACELGEVAELAATSTAVPFRTMISTSTPTPRPSTPAATATPAPPAAPYAPELSDEEELLDGLQLIRIFSATAVTETGRIGFSKPGIDVVNFFIS